MKAPLLSSRSSCGRVCLARLVPSWPEQQSPWPPARPAEQRTDRRQHSLRPALPHAGASMRPCQRAVLAAQHRHSAEPKTPTNHANGQRSCEPSFACLQRLAFKSPSALLCGGGRQRAHQALQLATQRGCSLHSMRGFTPQRRLWCSLAEC